MALLREYASDVTSQDGEDGMLARLIEDLRLGPGLCVEFGAWDGKHLSNTWTLWAEHGWRAVLIEADPYRFEILKKNTVDYPGVHPVHALVGTDASNSLERVVPSLSKDPNFNLLSIDIDGDDYWVWKAIDSRPPVVIIEYNCSFPPEVDFVPKIGSGTGASAAAFVRLAQEKGYVLVDLNKANLVFVRRDLKNQLSVETRPLPELFDRSTLPLLYSDMRGVHHLVKPGTWGFSGLRADLGREGVRGRLRYLTLKTAKWASRKNIPWLSSWLRVQAHRFSRG